MAKHKPKPKGGPYMSKKEDAMQDAKMEKAMLKKMGKKGKK